jgi:NarL family two-component system response regulator LiaR
VTIAERPIRVLLANDHPLVRDGIRSLLQTQPDIELVGETTSGSEVAALASELVPDVIVLDLVKPQVEGAEALARIVEAGHGARVLVVTSFAEDERALSQFESGSLSYILKEAPPLDLAQAIRDVRRG